jgi:outer membrane protein
MRTQFFLLLMAVASVTYAQTQPAQKIGYVDMEYMFTQLPEFKQVTNELKTHNTQLENQLKAKYQEYEAKVKAYQAMPATTADAIRADKEREIQGLQESIQKFQQDAETSMRNKESTLMQPVYAKISKAIEDVSKENGYTFIINGVLAGNDILLYSDEKFDISALVLKKLGVTPTPPQANKTN